VAGFVLNNLDPPPVQLVVIKLVDGSLHVSLGGELHDPFISPVLVSISVGDVPSLSHQVLQVLPANPGAEVLHSDPVVSPGGRSIFVKPWGSRVSPGPAGPVPAPVPPRSPRVLHGHSLAHQLLAIQLINRIISVSVVLELDEPKALFDEDVRGTAVALEEPLEVPLPHTGWHVAYVNTASWHGSILF